MATRHATTSLCPPTHLAGAAARQAVPHKQGVQGAEGQSERRVCLRLVCRRTLEPCVRDVNQVLELLQGEGQGVVVLPEDHSLLCVGRGYRLDRDGRRRLRSWAAAALAHPAAVEAASATALSSSPQQCFRPSHLCRLHILEEVGG